MPSRFFLQLHCAALSCLWMAAPVLAQGKSAEKGSDSTPIASSVQARYGTARLRHEQAVQVVAFSPDGKFVVSGARDFSIRVWDRATGALVHSLIHPTNRLAYGAPEASTPCLRFSPDGKLLLAGRGDGTILVWDAQHFKLLHKLSGSAGSIVALAIAPDSNTFVSADAEQSVRFWDLRASKETKQLTVPERATVLMYSRTGKQLLAGCQDGSIRVWQLDPLSLWRVIDAHERGVRQLATAPTGFLVASMGVENEVRLWNIAAEAHPQLAALTWNVLGGFPTSVGTNLLQNLHFFALNRQAGKLVSKGTLQAFDYLSDGSLLAGDARGLTLWDVNKEQPIRRFAADAITCLDVDSAGQVVATGDENGVIRLWEIGSGREIPVAPGPIWPAERIVASSGTGILVAYRNGPIFAWREAGETNSQLVNKSADGRTCLSTDGKLGAFAAPSEISVFEVSGDKQIARIAVGVKETRLQSLAVSSQRVAGTTAERTLSAWSIPEGKLLWQIEGLGAEPGALQFSADGKVLAGNCVADTLVLWDAATGKELRRLVESGANIVGWALSSDGALAATGHPDGIVRIWRSDTGRLLHVLEGHQGPVRALAFSNDNRALAAGSWLTLRLWEIASGKERLRLFDLPGECSAVTFLAGNVGMLIGTSNTQVVRVSLVPTELEIRSWTQADLEGFWKDLENADAGQAYRAIFSLVSSPDAAVGLLRDRLHPVPSLNAAQRQQQDLAIANLGSDQFEVRHQAVLSLEKLGEAAEPAIRIALAKRPSTDARAHLQELLQKLESSGRQQEHLRVARACEVLERLATAEARAILAKLAKGADGTRQSMLAQKALDRIGKTESGK
ncbi:hypothetical protein BH10PLA2_BH10PLA2_15280 [soil metagenome]